jgi:DNA mismatch endonuclease (patch repair protein)
MSSIRSKGTQIEKKLVNCLRRNGINGYRINPNMITHPDFIFPKYKIAIFCDGDFWHGKEYTKLKARLKQKFWKNKIETNIKRDKKHNTMLRKEGWIVLRFWESDINKNIKKCISKLKKELSKNTITDKY